MRLDFNMVVVDDDLEDEDNNAGIKSLIQQLEIKLRSKGFLPCTLAFTNVDMAKQFCTNRTDLYLSDNNLGDNPNSANGDAVNGGIEYYLELKRNHLSDFVLYTRSNVDSIVDKLINDLKDRKDPNLFSRFTFVSRGEGGTDWHRPIFEVIDHILTKREELNNLRGFYAQQTSKIDLHLKNKYSHPETVSFFETINLIPKKDLKSADKKRLHEVRIIRNGLMHNDEELCLIKEEYVIRFTQSKTVYEIYEGNLKDFRDKLNEVYAMALSI